MRLITAWSNVLSENAVLRIFLIVLFILFTLMSLIAAKLALKNPLLIERGCITSAQDPKSLVHTTAEVEAFIIEALKQRFDTDATASTDYLALDEFRLRAKEQEELARRQIKQRVIFNNLAKDGETMLVDSDRLLAVGTIRTAFSYPLALSLATVTRTPQNPYGLVLTKVTPVTGEQKGKHAKE